MAFSEVQTLDADNTVALGGRNKKTGKPNPTKVEGYYLGNRQVESKKSKSGLCYIHFLQTANGNLGVWGKTDLDRKLQAVAAGTMVRITQTGMQPTPNGDMYKFKVEQDSGNVIDVSDIQGGASNTSASDGEDGGGYDSTSDDEDTEAEIEDEEEAEEPPPRIAAKASNADAEARKAKVQALLSKGKRVG